MLFATGLATQFAAQGQGLSGALQSLDNEDSIEETQDFHLHTKARMGNIPIVAVYRRCLSMVLSMVEGRFWKNWFVEAV